MNDTQCPVCGYDLTLWDRGDGEYDLPTVECQDCGYCVEVPYL